MLADSHQGCSLRQECIPSGILPHRCMMGRWYKDVLRRCLTGRFPLLPEDSHRRQVCTPQSVLAGTIADVVLDISKWLILLTFSGRMSTSPKRLDQLRPHHTPHDTFQDIWPHILIFQVQPPKDLSDESILEGQYKRMFL